MRLQKVLAQAGIASRRKAEQLIEDGRIKVNGKVVTEKGIQVEKEDEILFDEKPIHQEEKVLYQFYKPTSVISSLHDPRGRKDISSFYIGDLRIFPIGRLDYDSEGLLLLTNDGDFANQMMHPRYEHEKEYHVLLERELTEKELSFLQTRFMIDEYLIHPVQVKKIGARHYSFTLHEGRNRQIRKMLEKVQVRIIRLKRIRIESFYLGKMKPGELRKIESYEEFKK